MQMPFLVCFAFWLSVLVILPIPQAAAQSSHLGAPVAALGPRAMDPSLPKATGRAAATTAPEWFWKEVSPDIDASNPARWPKIVRMLEQTRISQDPVYAMEKKARKILARWGRLIRREAAVRHLSVPLLVAVIVVESGGNPRAISPKGAGGLMQLMPGTAKRFGVRNSLAPAQNVRGGARYLDWLLKEFEEDTVLALAAYNSGENAVKRYDGVPPYRETRDYVAKVAAVFAVARRLCAQPPAGPRDTCSIR